MRLESILYHTLKNAAKERAPEGEKRDVPMKTEANNPHGS
jgi:hypothetical protein